MWRDILIVIALVAIGAGACIWLFDTGRPPPIVPGVADAGTSDLGKDSLPAQPAGDRGAQPPEVLIYEDLLTYSTWFKNNLNNAELDARRPQTIDYHNNQVVVIMWGDKPAGCVLAVESVSAGDSETVVTLRTVVPAASGSAARIRPGQTVVTPKGRRVRIVVRGDRLPAGSPFVDFQDSRELDFDVVVQPK